MEYGAGCSQHSGNTGNLCFHCPGHHDWSSLTQTNVPSHKGRGRTVRQHQGSWGTLPQASLGCPRSFGESWGSVQWHSVFSPSTPDRNGPQSGAVVEAQCPLGTRAGLVARCCVGYDEGSPKPAAGSRWPRG